MNGMYLSELDPQSVTIVDILEERAQRAPTSVFFSWGDDSTTVGDFNAATNSVAAHLLALGVGAGSHVATLMDTSPEYLMLWFAIAKIGAVEVAINSAYHGQLLRHQITAGRATTIVVDKHYASHVDELSNAIPTVELVLVRGTYSPNESRLRWLEFPKPSQREDEGNPRNQLAHQSIASVIFTSGTTGPSKGVLLTHHYLAAYGLLYAEVNSLKPDDVIFNFLPFFHMSGKFLTIATLAMNARMHLASRFSVSSFWDDCRKQGVTNFVGVGGICNMLLAQPKHPEDQATSIRTVYAVPDPADIHEEFEKRFNCCMTTVYGSTEVGIPISRGPLDPYKPGSCGRLSPYYEVAVVNEFDLPVAAGCVGEIVVRSKLPFLLGSGYIGEPERTLETWRNLWLHTGDRGRVDEDGWYWFEDRAGDSIRRRGENISSYELESLILRHPEVVEAAAVAATSDLAEDEVWVLVKLRPGNTATHEEILDHCARNMPYFMVPRYIEFVDDFPRTPTAKVEKYRLRNQGPSDRAWDREAHGWVFRNQRLVHEDPSSRPIPAPEVSA
jgi:carnitine-CoA ligase